MSQKVVLPCGRCIGCRLEKSKQWASRCVHEAQLHQENIFITLTLADEYLVQRYWTGLRDRAGKKIYGGTLQKKQYQDFMKRLRKHFAGKKIQYFHSGEYTDENRRPHYHALLFGVDFMDKVHFKTSDRGDRIYTSGTLLKLWGKGHCSIGSVSFESAAYIARYVVKKQTGEQAAGHYRVVDSDTGEVINLLPEYVTMSLKPAVGKGWVKEFMKDVYPDDFVVVRGKRMKPPKFYDRMHELEDP